MPGLVDRQTGWARHAVNLGVNALDLAGGIEAATGRRPSIDNDVKAAALGAHHAVRPEVADGTTAYLNVGTGLAAAIVRRGEVVRGAGGAAGEIGHLPVGSGRARARAGRTAASRPSPRAPRCTGSGRGPRPTCSPPRRPVTSGPRGRRDARARHRAGRAGARGHRCRARRHRRWPGARPGRARGGAGRRHRRPRRRPRRSCVGSTSCPGSGCSTATCRWPPSVRPCCPARPSPSE